jgi:phenylpropionate dioxygenase-like ring-hydroxylating dioxygenase large terminal subunit
MTLVSPTARRGASPAISYQELLDTDTHPVPDWLRLESPIASGPTRVPISRYLSREFHDLEVEKVWRRVWQVACREEDIPEVGDHHVYEIANHSILVVRSTPGEIGAFHNVCLHRGRILKEKCGRASELRCAFHGFAWKLDGSLLHIPSSWDFPDVVPDEFSLPEVKVGTWGGFVFVNMDSDCGPLSEHVAGLSEQFARWPLEDRYKQAHVAKVLGCNWKLAQEAFMEAYHVVATHPQLLPAFGDDNSQYDVFGNFARAMSPGGTPSPHLRWTPTEQEMADWMTDRSLDEPVKLVVPPGRTARDTLAEQRRQGLASVLDGAADQLCDAEVIDSFYFTVFPNFHPWGAYNRVAYRFRPFGDDHTKSVMECMYLAPFRPGERPPPAELTWLDEDSDWTEAPELGMLARVFNQDVYNLPKVQAGLEAAQNEEVIFAEYQETKLRHFHGLLVEWTDRD